jgi:acyl-CoA reductase-like NAD-dependent aldehyde dehydrogenase
MRTIQHWIAESETTGTSAMFGPVYDPATGRQQAQVALAERADVDAAVAAAAKAFEEWSETSLTRRARVDAYSYRQPIGVCAGITPFNFPAMVPMWMHPIAIAAGNTLVLKPSERDPSTSSLVPYPHLIVRLPAGHHNI